MATITTQLQINAKHHQRFVLSGEDGQVLGCVETHGLIGTWNMFLGWLVSLPIHDEMQVMENHLLVESKVRWLGAKYRISVNHQPVAVVVTHNFRAGYLINIKNEYYQLTTGPGETSFTITAPGVTQPLLALRQLPGTDDRFVMTVGPTLGLLTGTGLAMAILAGHGK
ncbi:hypothetical protein ACRYI5_01840 [Furfurilactobacillus sp. WILCCON 0119]|uniref:hypothetical protein n=1 Tax=Furfurilactobacillus entadae TaxID=2922307 RepID=UPI0035EF563D